MPSTVNSVIHERERRRELWHRENPGRSKQLNDALDACDSQSQKRALYASFLDEEKDAIMDEYVRRWRNRQAPVGSMVRPCHKHGFNIEVTSRCGAVVSSLQALHNGTATVIGSDDGAMRRYLMLHVPWIDKEGRCVVFAEAHAHELEVVLY